MLFFIIFSPLVEFLSSILLGRILSKGVFFITIISVMTSFFVSSFLFYSIISTVNTYKLTLSFLIIVDNLSMDWSFIFDSLTCIMLLIITFISSLVHLYSLEYMENDPILSFSQ